jgi:hypothetical protein
MAEEELRRRHDGIRPDKLEGEIIDVLQLNMNKYTKVAQEIINEYNAENDNEEQKIDPSKIVEMSDNEIVFLEALEAKNPKSMTAKERISLAEYRKKRAGGGDADAKVQEVKAGEKKQEEQKIGEISANKEEKKLDDADTDKPEKKTLQEVLEEKFKIDRGDYIKGEKLDDLTYLQGKAEAHYRGIYEKFHRDLFRWFKFFYPDDKDFQIKDYGSLEKIGINTPAKFLALYLQNQIHDKNADRKSAFTSGRYSNSWKEVEAEAFLQRTQRRLVLNKIKKESKKKNVNAGQASSTTQYFAYTDSLEEAAGILLGNGFDVSAYQYLLSMMRTTPELCILIKEKLMMLKHMEHRGVPLGVITFHLRHGGLKKLWKKFCEFYTYFEWKEIWFTK